MSDGLETPARIEPALFEERMPESLVNLAGEIQDAAHGLGRPLPARTRAELAGTVRVLNSYYSNLIEGHRTRPRDIERALADDLTAVEPERRALAEEAAAHVRLQAWIDERAGEGALPDATSVAFLRDLHRRFYEGVPEELRRLRASDTRRTDDGEGTREVAVVPGAFRASAGEDVAVGQHLPPSSTRVADFMAAFEARYVRARRPLSRLLALPAAHHRFNYIHPFVDGNGRVSRLMSHAMAHEAGVGADGLWSISRGLSRGLAPGLAGRAEYKARMAQADTPRQGSRDGRGNLSERALIDFSEWYLSVALDQIRFVAGLFDLDTLERRLARLVDRTELDPRAKPLLAAVLRLGDLPRGQAAAITGAQERTARTVLSGLIKTGLLTSDTPKGPVRLSFPPEHHETLFPRLFPEGEGD